MMKLIPDSETLGSYKVKYEELKATASREKYASSEFSGEN